MKTFYFNKLVRDKVLQRCLDDPKVKTYYQHLETKQYIEALIEKLHEETDEVSVALTRDELVVELADVQEVIDALTAAYEITKDEIKSVQQSKIEKNGAFADRAYIERVELDDDSEWVAVLRAQPDKYKEV